MHGPGSLITVAGVPETELACEDRLPNVALNLENLGAAFGFAVELEDESRVGFGFDVEVELGGGASLGFFPHWNPPIVEDQWFGLGARKLEWDGDFSQESAWVDTAGGATAPGVDRDFQTDLAGEDGFSGHLVEIGLVEVKGGGDGVELAVRELSLRRDEGDDGGLEREVA